MPRQPYKVEPIRDMRGVTIGYVVIHRETRERVLGSIRNHPEACKLCQCLNRLSAPASPG